MTAPLIKLMVDSGAFSAWNKNVEINLKDYIKYLQENKEQFFSYVSLDILVKGEERSRSLKDIEAAAKQGYKNLQIMKNAGLQPIPVFHQSDDFKWLEKFVEDGEPYIGVATRKDLSMYEDIRKRWLDKCFSIICNRKGKPAVKVHGFGITKMEYLIRYPFYTVDSTTWSLNSGFGTLLVPSFIDGKFVFRRPNSIIVSDAPSSSTVPRKHFEQLGKEFKEKILLYLETYVGRKMYEIRYNPESRRYANTVYQTAAIAAIKDIHFPGSHTGKSLPIERPMIMFATSLKNRSFAETLHRAKAHTQLLSYFDTRDFNKEFMTAYLQTGLIPSSGRKKPQSRLMHNWGNEGYRNKRRLMLNERLEKQNAEIRATKKA